MEEVREKAVKRKLDEAIESTEKHRLCTCDAGWVRCYDCQGRARPAAEQDYWIGRECRVMSKKKRMGPTVEHFALWQYCLSEPVEYFDFESQDIEVVNPPTPPALDHHSTPEHFELIKELLELEEAGEAVRWPERAKQKDCGI